MGIENPNTFLHVRRDSGFSPARISGHVTSGRLEDGVELAVAVNGRVRGLTRWFRDKWTPGTQRFRSLVPEDSFHPGSNSVDVYLVTGSRTRPSLVEIGSTVGEAHG